MASPVKDAVWLEWIAGLMGLGSRQTETATMPPGQFHCLLDELPLHLIPQQFGLRAQRWDNGERQMFFNPQCSVLPPGQVPEELEQHRDLLSNFNLRRTIAWVRDAGTGSLLPFWLGSQLESALSSFLPGDPPLASIPAEVRSLLAGAGILIPAGYAENRVAEWASIVKKCARQFQERGYAPLRHLIHPFHLAALRRYYRHDIRRGDIRLGDEHVPRRYVAHNDAVARFFHNQIANVVSAVVGETVKPSYVYLASYLSGAELKKHTDRQQCEFSVTLCLDFSPEPQSPTSWPICLDTKEGSVAVYQALGDGLVYRGTRLPHYRSRLADGHTSTSIFFHYVHENFAGPLE
jgi:hypothetical protein